MHNNDSTPNPNLPLEIVDPQNPTANYIDTATSEVKLRNIGASWFALYLEARGIMLREIDGKLISPDQGFFEFLSSQGAPSNTEPEQWHVDAWNYHMNSVDQPNPYQQDEE
jgi:hypothetical protein